jgi:hypothetical protein
MDYSVYEYTAFPPHTFCHLVNRGRSGICCKIKRNYTKMYKIKVATTLLIQIKVKIIAVYSQIDVTLFNQTAMTITQEIHTEVQRIRSPFVTHILAL